MPTIDPNTIIMTKASNAPVLAVCYAQGWCSHEDYMTAGEADAVTDIGDKFKANLDITAFDELRFFTGLTELKNNAFYNCKNLSCLTLPDNVTTIRGGSIRFEPSTANHRVIFPKTISIPYANSVYNWAGYSTGPERILIFLSETPPTLGAATSLAPSDGATLKIYVPDNAVNDYKAMENLAAAYVDNILPLSQCPAKYLEYHEYKPTFVRGDAGRRSAIITGYDYRIREWSRRQYLTFEAAQDNTQVLFVAETGATTKTVSVSTDNGLTWDNKTSSNEGTVLATLDRGEKVLVKGNNNAYYASKRNAFSASAPVYCYGNVHSLVAGDNFVGHTTLSSAAAFRELFYGFGNLRTDPKKGYIVLPALSVPGSGYLSMFQNSGIVWPPLIDATSCGMSALNSMFANSALYKGPEIHLTSLGLYGCSSMCAGCTSLVYPVPILPATSGYLPYTAFYQGDTALKFPTKLPATDLSSAGTTCYGQMYDGCSSLIEMSDHPATVLVQSCYESTYRGCSSLTAAKELPATILAVNCYSGMFRSAGIEEIVLPAPTLVQNCYSQMFAFNGGKMKKITCLATDISASGCVSNWLLNGAAANGTFIKAASMTSWPSGTSGIPSGWTVQDYVA